MNSLYAHDFLFFKSRTIFSKLSKKRILSCFENTFPLPCKKGFEARKSELKSRKANEFPILAEFNS